MDQNILAPVVALAGWSLVMWVWMYATRLPAMLKARIKLDPTVPPAVLTSTLPPRVRWKADNYNHLMEQPTIFYALALTLAVAGTEDALGAWIAWAYVGLRIAHSGVQALINIIAVRFFLFVVSSLCLMALAVRAAMAVF
ncbi:MAPEG family protein [Brevundimonas sp.]|uniref:MAPEG family protein n=1 Tax=Brevundimonas sp. TaxID=1871086 RepID=UPI00286D064F|nr:MAPEG family protein [Brevundimonas sp.]